MHQSSPASDCVSSLRVLLHIPNFFTAHTLTHTHTQTGWLLTGTNALMALSYILGTLVSVGNFTHPP